MAVAESMRLFTVVAGLVTVGCATTASRSPVQLQLATEVQEGEWASWPLTPLPVAKSSPSPSRLVKKAARLVGLSTLRAAAPHLPDDCTGLVRAVYEDSGIELMGAGVRGDNGVTAMYRLAFERSALHTTRPTPGDLVFFKETYDRNRDGRVNDGLTHVGVVESIEADGTVLFVHRVGRGVVRGKMNVSAPRDREHNDYLRAARKGSRARFTGELFVTYASALRLTGASPVKAMSASSRRGRRSSERP